MYQISFVMPACLLSAWNSSAATGFLLNLVFEDFSKICTRKFQFNLNLTRITSDLHEDPHIRIYDNISLNSSYNHKYFGQNLYRKLKRTFYFKF